jgi:hypothetical protein
VPSPLPSVPSPARRGTSSPAADPLVSDPAIIRAKGYTPDAGRRVETPDGFGNTLYAWIAICTGSADGHCQNVFFFIGTRYLGTDTSVPSSQINAIAAFGPQTVDVTYANYRRGDPLCCPSGPPVTIRYRWTGTRLIPSGTPPGH